MSTLFISDLHFGRKPNQHTTTTFFMDENDYNNTIIERWNNAVNENDTVYILGDVSQCPVDKTIEIFRKLKGNKVLIVGNNDQEYLDSEEFRELFKEIADYKEVEIDGEMVVLSHYPILSFKNSHIGWFHLYGHTHTHRRYYIVETAKYLMQKVLGDSCEMFNVGAMVGYMDYTPRTLEYIVRNRIN